LKLIKKYGVVKEFKGKNNNFDCIGKNKSKFRLFFFDDVKSRLYEEEKEIIFLFLFYFNMQSLDICYNNKYFITEKNKNKYFHFLLKIENKLMINLIGKKV
jgi:hypothetical protein